MQQDKKSERSIFFSCICIALMFLIIPRIYAVYTYSINSFLLALAQVQLSFFTPFFEEAAFAHAEVKTFHAEALTWLQVESILHYVGTWARYPMAFFLVLLGIASIFMGKTSSLVRKFTMESLLQNNAESFACLRPIVGRGKYLISTKSYDQGLWRMAQSPLQFSLEKELLTDESGTILQSQNILQNGLATKDNSIFGKALFTHEKATSVLEAQLGHPLREFHDLSPCRKVIMASFLAYADGDKRACLELLDAVAADYTEKNFLALCPLFEQKHFIEKTTALYEKHTHITQDALLMRHNHYELPFFMALLTRARKKGVLANAQFLWLRPLDRPLWYALHQCGGHTAWAEALASWEHYMAEEKAQQSLEKAQVHRAATALHKALDTQGWLINSDPSRTYAEAEEDVDEYDSYDDSALHHEDF